MERALERHDSGQARVIPIIIRPVEWKGAPFDQLNPLPKDAKPVTVWTNRDQAWVDVAKGISKAAQELAEGAPAAQTTSGKSLAPSIAVASPRTIEHPPTKSGKSQLQRTIYDAKNGRTLPGIVARQEGDPVTGDASVDEAYEGLGIAYNFFLDAYGRDSIDDQGLPLNGHVHYGNGYNNAFWDGQRMIFGDGDGVLFNRFTLAIDVIGKEYANGVISTMSDLVYYGESGAIFNSAASVFAVLIKQYALQQTADEADWLLGAGLFGPKVQAKALNSIAAPGTAFNDPTMGKDPQPAHMREYVQTVDDNGGVHINSGIPNRAFYLVATALGGFAWQRAGTIWYESLRDKQLEPQTHFSDFARITYVNAQRLYGDDAPETLAVKYGWDIVGIGL